MPLNLSSRQPRNTLTKQQKAEQEASVRGLKVTITPEDVDFAQRLIAQKEDTDE